MSAAHAYKCRWLCKQQQGCVGRDPAILAFPSLLQPGASGGREGGEKGVGARAQGWGEPSTPFSPAQVAVHGFHAVVLAAGKRAQLVEGHSWREREAPRLEP